jgi:hypothetical protein
MKNLPSIHPVHIINALLLVALAALAWNVISLSQSTVNVTAAADSSSSNYKAGGSWQWFDKDENRRADNIVRKSLGRTSITATLNGVINSGGVSVASISVRGRESAVYAPGEEISRGVTVHRIENTRVILREHSALRELPLASLDDNLAGGDTSGRSQPLLDLNESHHAEGLEITAVNGTTGVTLKGLSSRAASVTGLRSDDTVISIDGRPIVDYMQSGELQTLASLEQANVIVVRDGNELPLTIDTKDFAQDLIRQIHK